MTYNTIFICCKYQNLYVPFHIFYFYLIIQQIAFYEIKEKQRNMHSNYFQDICLDARFGNKFALQGIIFYYKPCKLYSTYTNTHTYTFFTLHVGIHYKNLDKPSSNCLVGIICHKEWPFKLGNKVEIYTFSTKLIFICNKPLNYMKVIEPT